MKYHNNWWPLASPGRNLPWHWLCEWWWRHQMETFSPLLAFCAGNSPVTVEFSSQRPVTRRFDVFCARIKGWVNNREAGDFRRHRAHYDVTLMNVLCFRNKFSMLSFFDSNRPTLWARDVHAPVYLFVFNTSTPSAAYMRQWTRSALVQIKACRLFGVRPLS